MSSATSTVLVDATNAASAHPAIQGRGWCESPAEIEAARVVLVQPPISEHEVQPMAAVNGNEKSTPVRSRNAMV